jgi:hypothetical protein
MAQWRKDIQVIDDSPQRYEIMMIADDTGNINDDYHPFKVKFPNGTEDAFGRIRTAEAFTLGDYKHLYAIDPNFLDEITSSASITHYPNQACARLAVTSTPGSKIIHQTKYYHHYMPGKSQLIKSTFNFYAATAGVRKRTGYFDANNGIFFEQTGTGELAFNIRTYVTGSVDDSTNRVTQANWNIDKCDGTGKSGFNLDITKTQIFFTDFQWLGVGRVRCGFVHDGKLVIAHEYYNSNNKPTVYMSNPNLPIRCEIENVNGSSAAYMDQICSTVVAEGGYIETGQDWAAGNDVLRSVAGATGIPVFALRLKNTFKTYENRMTVRLSNINVFSESENVMYKVIKLPNATYISGATGPVTWNSFHTDSGVEYAIDGVTYSDGEQLDMGYASASSQNVNKISSMPATFAGPSAKKNYIAQNYSSNNSEIYIVYVKNLSASAATNVGVSLQWREIY